MTAARVELTGVVKDYRGLRPLRIQHLQVTERESVAIVGLDRASAEVLVNLITGATLPDAGDVRIFDRATSAIADSAEWLSTVDRFGLVTERAVLLDAMTVVQNLAMSFTLDIEPPPDDVRVRAQALASEVGIPEHAWDSPVARLEPSERTRVRLARAVAMDPAVLLLEHASAGVSPAAAPALGADIRRIVAQRRIASIAVTADETFARAVADRVLRLEPATGRLVERRPGWVERIRGR